jgi:signal transduction histidine kinase
MSGVAALGLTASWTLRRQVKRQMNVISGQLRAETISEERDRMARELHDTLEQQLSGVALQLDGLDHTIRENPGAAATSLALARRMLRFTRIEARRSVWDLRSKVLQREGLPAALRALAETGNPAGGPAVEIHTTGAHRPLPGNADFHLLRIAQEAITNALKHAAPTHIIINLDYLADETRLVIRDDGRGFDPAAATPSAGQCFGLLGMRERAAKTGAVLDIHSEPGHGTTITASVPCQPATQSP